MKVALTPLARKLRSSQTDAEHKLWSRLRNRQIDGWRFKRQVPRGPYIVDFLCFDAGLVIEVDGSQHLDQRAEHDRRRTTFLEGEGLKVLRFWNSDVLTNIEGVVETIYLALGQHPAPSPGGSRVSRRPLPEGRGEESSD